MPLDPTNEYRRYRRYFVDLRSLYKRRDVIVYTGITLSLLAIAFFGVFALRPTIITIIGLTKDIKNKQEINNKLQQKINSLTLAQKNLSSVERSLGLLDNALPKDPLISQVLYQMEFLLIQENLTIRSFSIEPVTITGPIMTKSKVAGPDWIGFSLAISGGFENLNRFASSLESLRRLVSIDSLTYVPTKSEEGRTAGLNLSLSGRIYFLAKGDQ